MEKERQMESRERGLTRRGFLQGAASLAALSTIAIVPRHVLGGPGQTPPSEKLNIAGVGPGGQGGSDINSVSSQNIVALCDVDMNKAAGMFKKYPQAKRYQDYRLMLEQQDIDAVVIGTPDHTHAIITMAAMRLGKHVYTEKPLTHSVYEARKLRLTAREHKLATQMGNQGQASEAVRSLQEYLEAGAIGDVREVHVWTDRPVWAQGIDRPTDTPNVPDGLDWDLWLGPAPARPYHPVYHPFAWRGWWDFGTGAPGDIACHALAPVFRVLDLGHPLTVEASGSKYSAGNWQVKSNPETYPRASIVRYRFPARGKRPPVKICWYDGGLKPARPPELESHRDLGSNGTMFIGDKGAMLDGRILPEEKMKEFEAPPKRLPRSPGHHQEWIDACKGGPPAGSNFDVAGVLTEAVLLGNVALRAGRRLRWDGEKMEITNHRDANQFLHREYRKGWVL